MHTNRLTQLEGLRGLGALSVVFSHLVLTFIPVLWTTDPASIPADSWLINIMTATPLRILFDGALAVKLFFLHSGFVLSYQYFTGLNQSETLSSAAIRRYIRLTGPLAASVMFAYLLMTLGWLHHQELVKAAPRIYWLGHFYTFEPNIFDALYQAFLGAYFAFDAQKTYNTVLWTISTELIGSFLIYGSLALIGKARNRWVGYIALVFLNYKSDLLAFVIGMAFCDLWVSFLRDFSTGLSLKKRTLIGTVLLALGAYFGTYRTPQFAMWSIFVDWSPKLLDQFRLIGALGLLCSALMMPRFSQFLNWKPISHLGRLSYSVYLFHLAILCSIGSYVAEQSINRLSWSYTAAAVASTITTLIVTLGVSFFAAKWFDQPSIALGKWVYARFFKPGSTGLVGTTAEANINVNDSRARSKAA